MAAKPLEIHPAALEEFKSALTWYLERSESSASRFVAEVDKDHIKRLSQHFHVSRELFF